MPEPLLLTKLYVPTPRAQIILRPRLVERLNEGLRHKLTLISASAGFGKTTLVSEWIENCRLQIDDCSTDNQHSAISNPQFCWLSLDEGDSDPERFMAYLVAALQTISANVGKGVSGSLQNPQPPAIESILIALLNEITTTIPGHFVLVLDDYHVVESKPVDDALAFLLDHLPPQMHLVIATREDPSLPLARLRVRGQLTELRAADLRFTPEEASAFLNQVMNLNLSAEDIASLENRTEGWIAGLQLAALSMQGRQDIAGFIQAFTGSHRFVLDYLVEEVLHRQSEPIRDFLLQSAVLDRLCAPLCNAVTEREGCKEILDFLERSNLFLIPLDDDRQWYRYHHLFADVLQAHLIEAQPDRVAALHRRASIWYERNGFPPDAIRHTLAAKDFERAASLIELAWPAAEMGSILPTTWLSWVKALPDELVRARPVLTVWYAYALLGRGEIEAAETRLQDAERWLEHANTLNVRLEHSSTDLCPESSRRMVVTDQNQFKSLPATIAVGRAYIAQAFGNIPDTVRYASQVLELPDVDPFRYSQASMLLGMTCWASGDLQAANRIFADYTLKLRTAGNIPDAISTTVVLADIRLVLGRLREAISSIEKLMQFVMDQGEPISPDIADLHRELGELYLEQGNPKAAAQSMRTSKELGEKVEQPVGRYRWCISQARFDETQGDLDGALALLDKAERLYIRTPLPDLGPISALKARIWVAQGRLIEAQGWVRKQGLSPDDDLCFLREFEHITLARILLAQYRNERMDGSIAAVMLLLERLRQAAEEGCRMGSVIEILVLQALANQAQGDIPRALAPLERALDLAEPEGYVRIFVDEGEKMRMLILDFRMLIEKKPRDQARKLISYIDRLLAAFSGPMGEGQSTTDNQKSKIRNQKSTLVEPLSERELEVLRLLRTDLSGPEIARELVVSLSTLRTHTQNIFTKLGVNNRRAAVRRAEELELL